MEERLFNTIEKALDKDFYEIYEDDGEKRIIFCGYVYTNGEPGTDENGEFDETLTYRIVEYSGDMDFSLEEYLHMSEQERDYAYDIRGNDYIGDVTEEEAFEAVNNWFGKNVKVTRLTEKLTMDTPVGYYVK